MKSFKLEQGKLVKSVAEEVTFVMAHGAGNMKMVAFEKRDEHARHTVAIFMLPRQLTLTDEEGNGKRVRW